MPTKRTNILSPDHWLSRGNRVQRTYDFALGTVVAYDQRTGYVLVKWDDHTGTRISEFDLDIPSEEAHRLRAAWHGVALPDRRAYSDRDETDTCEAGTVGCCIDHTTDPGDCECF